MVRRLSALVAIAASVVTLQLGVEPTVAGYGSVPALKLPWADGGSNAENVSGFSYYYTGGCVINGTYYPNDRTRPLDYYALDFGLNYAEVDASAYGQVAATGYDSVGGYYIFIEHPTISVNLTETYYGHLSSISVSVNQYVSKGQAIGVSGNSGSGSSGPHMFWRFSTGASGPFDYANGLGLVPEPMSGLAPPGNINWQNYGCAGDSTTRFTATSPNQQVLVAPNPSVSEDLLVRGTTADGWFTPTDSHGNPLAWQSAGGVVKDQISGVWDNSGQRLDLFAIGPGDQVNHRAWVSGSWQGDWSSLSTTCTAGQSETEAVNATRRPDGSIDLFFRGGGSGCGGTCTDASHCAAIHVHTDAFGGNPFWENIGGAIEGAPAGRWDSTPTSLDVFAIGTDNNVWQKPYFPGRGWGVWQALNVEQASGQAEDETVSVVRRSDNSMDLFIRGPSGDAWTAHTDSGGVVQGSAWKWLGGAIRGAPDAVWTGTSRIDVFAIGVDDHIWRRTWTSPNSDYGPWTCVGAGGDYPQFPCSTGVSG